MITIINDTASFLLQIMPPISNPILDEVLKACHSISLHHLIMTSLLQNNITFFVIIYKLSLYTRHKIPALKVNPSVFENS